MPATPKRQGKEPQEGSRFPSEVIAANIRDHRVRERLSQEELAERMILLGHATWSRATLSELERGGRVLSADELLSLAIALEKTPLELLDPTGIDHEVVEGVDYGVQAVVPVWVAHLWQRGLVSFIWTYELTLGVRLTDAGYLEPGASLPQAASVVLKSLQLAERDLRETQATLEQSFRSMGMSQASAAAAAEGRQRPALFWLSSPEIELTREQLEQEREQYLDALPEQDFVDPPESLGEGEE
jgi:Helix-turn-helix domain